MSDEPLMGCALGLRADDLSAWRDGALDAAAKARLDAHIGGCSACRARLAEYDAIALGLRAIPTPAPIHGFGRNPRRAGAAPTGRPTPARRSPIGRRQALGGLGAIAAVALLLFAFTQVFGRLGVQPPSADKTATSTALATATATATATALPTLPTTTIAAGACGKYFPSIAKLTPANGLVVTQYSGLGNLAYPTVQIPSSQPLAPMLEPTIASPEYWAANTTPIVNPGLREGGGGYVLGVCNPSSQAHTISAVQVTIASMAPFTDQLGSWEPCSGVYYPVGGNVSGGCGGGDVQDEYMHAAFAADAPVGASITATQTGANVNSSDIGNVVNLGPLPVTLKPGQAMTIEVGVTEPSVAGYYTYSFALTVDGANTGTVAYSLMSLLAPPAHVWTGAACKTPAMLALIAKEPTPTARTAYICPAS